ACAMLADNNQYAFNEFLRVAFESGMVGLLLFAGLLAAAFRAVWRGSAVACRAGGILVAVMCFGLFGYPLSEELVTVVAVVALAVAAGGEGGRSLGTGRLPVPVRRGIAVAVVCFFFFCTSQYVAGKRADGLLRCAQGEPSALSGTEAERCYRRWRANADFVLCYGKMLYNHGRYGEALPVLERAARLKPMSRLLCDLGDCYREGGEFRRAAETYGVASRMTPTHILPQYRLFCLWRDTGREEEAVERARYMLAMRVKVVNTSVLRYRHEARQFLNGQLQTR
ncbi:MAG: tetratricopeptide repeat protein, partial [Odoribacter sp.]|nr:tetratricopeptide repeat protein [Odoribacter sp.]